MCNKNLVQSFSNFAHSSKIKKISKLPKFEVSSSINKNLAPKSGFQRVWKILLSKNFAMYGNDEPKIGPSITINGAKSEKTLDNYPCLTSTTPSVLKISKTNPRELNKYLFI